jgi:Spy/CpxP family protein refolding chaperone
MKFRVIMLCAILFSAAAIVLSQEPPTPPPQPAEPQEPPMAQQHPPRAPEGPPPGQPQGPPPPGQPMPQHAPRPGQPNRPGEPPRPPEPPDPIAQNLFPPEMVMQHRQEIGLTDEQNIAIRQELRKASTRFNELQWQMEDEMETMNKMTKASAVDEKTVMAELDKILNIEREVKRTQLLVSVRIKNKLTAEQQVKLQELRHKPPQR